MILRGFGEKRHLKFHNNHLHIYSTLDCETNKCFSLLQLWAYWYHNHPCSLKQEMKLTSVCIFSALYWTFFLCLLQYPQSYFLKRFLPKLVRSFKWKRYKGFEKKSKIKVLRESLVILSSNLKLNLILYHQTNDR